MVALTIGKTLAVLCIVTLRPNYFSGGSVSASPFTNSVYIQECMTQTPFQDAISPWVNNVNIDVLGNVIAHKVGIGPRLMIAAHIDRVAMMITYIDAQGFLYVKPYGHIDINILQGITVRIQHKERSIPGIIGRKPIHLQRSEMDGKLSWEDIWIDIGAKSKEDALTLVQIGDFVFFDSPQAVLSNGYIANSAMDDQCGINALVTIASNIQSTNVNYDIYFVATNFEEIGMRGAMVAANTVQPDICIVIDATHATDYPGMNPIRDGDIRLGAGAVLTIGPNIDVILMESFIDIAKGNGIPYQVEVNPYATGTDANVIQVSQQGVSTIVVSVPCRYMHTPCEVVAESDIESVISLITKYITNNG